MTQGAKDITLGCCDRILSMLRTSVELRVRFVRDQLGEGVVDALALM